MGFYIEMISVGEGDCFFLTLDNPGGNPVQILIDGGNRDQANKIVEHIKKYGNGYAELIIGTHLDDDHIGGLIGVIENIRTGKLILNTPGNFERWLRIRDYVKQFEKVTSIKKLERGIAAANDLLETAKRNGVAVENALQGQSWFCEDVKM